MDVHESDRSSENPRPPSNLAENNDATNRHGRSKSSWGLSTAVHAVHGVGFVAKKVINNRYTDSLWHSKKSTSTASVPSDATDAKRENHSHENVNHHTSQLSLNVADKQTPKLTTHEGESNLKTRDVENLKPQDGSHDCTTGSDVVDRSENTKPTFGIHVKPVNQHRRPTSSTSGSTVWPSTTGSNVVDPKPSASSHVRQVNQQRWPSATSSNAVNQSENSEPQDGSHARLVNQHLWPGTVGSNVLNKNINHPYEASMAPNLRRASFPNNASKPLQESTSDATNLPSSSLVDEGRLKTDKFIESQPSSPNKSYVLTSKGVSPSCTRVLTPARDVPSFTAVGVKPSPIVRGTTLTPATRSASDTTTEDIPISTVRGVSPTPTARSVCPPPPLARDTHTPIMSSTPPKSDPLDKETGLKPTRGRSPTPSRWLSHPLTTRGVSPTPTRGASPTPTRGVSPTPTRGVGPTPVKPSKPSGRRHFFNANILSVFTKMVDNRKEKNVGNLKEVAQHLELLYNIQVQWQFANASAEAALDLQRATAEKSLFDVWRTILELRDSIASKRVDMDLLILQLKLYAVLYRQMAYIDEWASIQKEHESALFATTNDLQARSLSVPITGGVKADIKGLKLIVFSSIQVLQATISCIQSTISKLDKTHFLASELANLVLHERALLDECELFLASAAPLHIEECSLRSYLLQSNPN